MKKYIRIKFRDYIDGVSEVEVYGEEDYYDYYINFFKKLGFETRTNRSIKLVREKNESWYEDMVKYINEMINDKKGKTPFISTSKMASEIGKMPEENIEILKDQLTLERDEDNNLFIFSKDDDGIYMFYRDLFSDMGFEVGTEEAVLKVEDRNQRKILDKVVKYINEENYKVVERPKITIKDIETNFPDLEIYRSNQELNVSKSSKYINITMNISILEPTSDVNYYVLSEDIKEKCTFVRLKRTPDNVPYRLDIKNNKDVVYKCYRNINKFYYMDSEVEYKR